MLVFDVECFKEDWLLVALDLTKKEKTVIHNDREALQAFYEKNKTNIWVGYNVRGYDQYIVKAILCDFNPKTVNDFIIKEHRKGYEFSREFNKITLPIFDIMPNPPVGLKTLEGFMGVDIRETTVPFDIDRELTPKELEEVIFYCSHDVECTAMVLSKRLEEYTSQLELVKMFDMPRTAMGKTKAQLSAEILGAVRTPSRGDEFNYSIPTNLKIVKYQRVVDWFKNAVTDNVREIDETLKYYENLEKMTKKQRDEYEKFKKWKLNPESRFYKRSLEIDVAGAPHVFGWGGIHGAKKSYHEKGRFINVDVASYYPSMMIKYGFESRNIKNPAKYAEIYHTRLEYKAKKDKRANPMKIILNSSFGATKDPYNKMYDPMQANNICVTGQLFLLDLLEQLENSKCCDVVQLTIRV